MTFSPLRFVHFALLAAVLISLLGAPAAHADSPPTKLGMGLYLESYAARDAIFQMHPAVVLMQDPSLKLPHEIKEKLPKTLIIGRYSVEDTVTPEGAVRYADAIDAKFGSLKGAITAWTFYNEPGVQKPGEAAAFDRAQEAFAQRMHQHGWRVAGFNFGVGVLEPGDYPRLFPRSLPLVDYIGVHAYGSEKDFFMSGPDRDYYALRYRKIRAATLAAGFDKPFVLTETGTWSGWKGKASVGDVVQDYMWLEREIEKDDYVVGQVPFLLDGFAWDGFRLLDTDAVTQFTATNQNRAPANYATRTPTPTVTSTPVHTPTPPSPTILDILAQIPSLEEARRHLPVLQALMRLPPEMRAAASKQVADQLGISQVTLYQWLTWLEVNGELGDLTPATPTPIPTPVPQATPAPEAVRTEHRVFLPAVIQNVAPPTPRPSPTGSPAPTLSSTAAPSATPLPTIATREPEVPHRNGPQ